MKLYVKTPAPSVIKVQIFLDECSCSIEEIEVGDTRAPAFLAISPFGTVPVLQTDSGELISESLTICRYLDSRWDSGLFGRSEAERLQVELWERRSELRLYVPAIEYVHQALPMFADRIDQHPKWAKVLAARTQQSLPIFNAQLERSEFMAGDSFSAADITAYLGFFAFAAFKAIDVSGLPALARWSETVAARPSMNRLRALTM